jgi:hypothetical protein
MRKFIEVPEDYYCPFCPSHKDDDFLWNKFLNKAICHGCSYDLFYEVTTEMKPDKFYTDIIKQLTGRPYEEYQLDDLAKNNMLNDPEYESIVKNAACMLRRRSFLLLKRS